MRRTFPEAPSETQTDRSLLKRFLLRRSSSSGRSVPGGCCRRARPEVSYGPDTLYLLDERDSVRSGRYRRRNSAIRTYREAKVPGPVEICVPKGCKTAGHLVGLSCRGDLGVPLI